MQRSCSLRWRCFVTPGTVSSAPSRQTVELRIAPHGTEDYTAWNVLGSSLYQLTPQGSVTMPHFRSVYCSILLYLALFVWIILFLDYLYVILLVFFFFRCLPFSDLFSTLQIILVSCQGTSVNCYKYINGMFLRNKIVRYAVFPVSFALLFHARISLVV